MKRALVVIPGIGVLIALAVMSTMQFYRMALDIEGDVEVPFGDLPPDQESVSKPVVRISVISRYPPNVISNGYQPVLDYLNARTPYRFELALCGDYREALELLLSKNAAAAFLGSYLYIDAHRDHGVIPILKPLNSTGQPYSRSVLFTAASSGIHRVRDLAGRTLALPSEESYSSNWVLRQELPANGVRVGALRQVRNFPYHQIVIHQVSSGAFDAGVTREYLIDRMQRRSIRVLSYSDPFPTSPIVVAADHDTAVVGALTRVLLAIDDDPGTRARITRGWDQEFVHGFVEAADSDYDVIRSIRNR